MQEGPGVEKPKYKTVFSVVIMDHKAFAEIHHPVRMYVHTYS